MSVSINNCQQKCSLSEISSESIIEVSAPCRIDMGGTLDIRTFYYPLRHLKPCTFNIAVNLRTRVRISPYNKGRIKISSKGFECVEYPADEAPFDHPLGLMFAIAAYFRADGVHIEIESASPPRSALGGSSVAGVALVAAFLKRCSEFRQSELQQIPLLAHGLEESVAGVPCGLQDQLAAAYGGVNAWYWTGEIGGPIFKQKAVVEKPEFADLEKHLLLAYCGIPHESKNINGKWVQQFLSGKHRGLWAEIISCTQKFVDALAEGNYKDASEMMNRETAIRRKMTPDVLDEMGEQLVESAVKTGCGARFTGAGGGGCLWALGEIENIDSLKEVWESILAKRQEACLLNIKIDSEGVR
ncbi:MAG: galactokinase [Desulfobacteraceae bacterium IS3]|nr:MAG: galactokinase [Desulfobacteraceae bacterium IS3]